MFFLHGWLIHSMKCFLILVYGFKIFCQNLQAPSYPDPGRCWDIVDKYKVTLFYTAPTLVRALMRESDEVKMMIFH